MYSVMQHTHPNLKRGKDEPLFITVYGPKEKCRKCQEDASLKDARSPKNALQNPKIKLDSVVSSGVKIQEEAVMPSEEKKTAKKAAKKASKAKAATSETKVASAHRFAGHSIKVLNKEHGAREGTKRAKAMEILLASKNTDDAIPQLEKIGADNSFIKFAVDRGLISLAA